MKSKKGQALLEFVLVLPIFLMLLLAIVDLGRILYEKNHLENVMSDITDMLDADLTETEIVTKLDEYYRHKIDVKFETKDKYKIIELDTSVDIFTPGMQLVLSDPYDIEISRVMYNE